MREPRRRFDRSRATKIVLPAIALSLALCVSSASAAPSATASITFKPFTFGWVTDGFLGSATPRNRVVIARTRAQALRWDRFVWHRWVFAPQTANFVTEASVGVFMLGRPAAAVEPGLDRNDAGVQGVVITSMSVSGDTLFLSLATSSEGLLLRHIDPDGTPYAYFSGPNPPSFRYHAFAIFSVPKRAVAHVRRVVVTQELHQTSAIVVNVDVPTHA